MYKNLVVAGIIAGAVVISSIGGVIIHKVNKIGEKFNKSFKDLEKATEKDISEALVKKAVEEAADETVQTYIRRVGDTALADSKAEVRDAVRKAVQAAKAEINEQVSDRISAEAALIDMEELQKATRAKAEEKILSKFNGNLDDLLGKFNENLSNVQKIYDGIAEAMGKKDSGKEIKFSVG